MRVELSLDGGATWLETELLDSAASESDSEEQRHPRVLSDGSIAADAEPESETRTAFKSASARSSPEKEGAELPHEKYAWTRWRVRLPAERVLEAARAEAAEGSKTRTRDARTLHVMCRATDSSYGTQPLDVAPIWNMRGLLHTAVHRIILNVS